MKKQNGRVAWLDLAKFIAIFFMVWCHTQVPRTLDVWVHSFHMPIFFIISGWCFDPRKHPRFLPFLWSRVKSLMIPYFFWGTILYLGWQTYFYLTDPAGMVPVKTLLTALFWDCAVNSPFAVVQWFLPCMFFAQLMAWWLLRLGGYRAVPVLLFAVFTAGFGWLLPKFCWVSLPMALNVALPSCGFFLAGWLIPRHLLPRLGAKIKRLGGHPLWAIGLFCIGSGLAFVNGYVNMRLVQLENPLLFYSAGLLLSVGIFMISRSLCAAFEDCRWLNTLLFLGQNTLPVLMLNQVFIRALKLVIIPAGWYGQLSLAAQYAVWLVLAVAVVFILMPVILFLNRAIPVTVGRKANKSFFKQRSR